MLSADKLKNAFKKVEDENWILRSFLKGQDPEDVDSIVHRLHNELFEDFNCIACSNCCATIVPLVEDDEIEVISTKLELTAAEFKSQYLTITNEGFVINNKPCPFLTADGCSIYDCRPANCREYPFTDKAEIGTRLINLVGNCEICPVVFEIFDKLKKHYKDEFADYKIEYQELWGNNNMAANNGMSSKNIVSNVKFGRNDPCPCGSGIKYKKCCGK